MGYVVLRCIYNLFVCEEAIGVASAVNVEANELSFVVDAVDNGGADAVGVVNGFPFGVVQRAAQQEAVHCTVAVHIATNDLIVEVDTKGCGVGRVREIELGIVSTFVQEAGDGRTIGSGQEADDIAIVVDAGSNGAMIGVRRNDGAEFAGSLVQFVGMIDAITVGVEADRDALIVNAQQLVDGARTCVGVLVGGEDAVPLDEAEVFAGAVDPEANRIAQIVEARYLCLDGAGEVLIGVVALSIR